MKLPSWLHWPWKRKDDWIHTGAFCEAHIVEVLKSYSETKVSGVNTENVELQQRCDIHGCKDYIKFMVERHRY